MFPEGKNQATIKELDEVLEQIKFDSLSYNHLRNELDAAMGAVIALAEKGELTPEEKSKLRELTEAGKPLKERLYQMIKPVYDQMIEKGYSWDQLAR